MIDRDLSAMYGLKYNPFLPQVPVEDLWRPPGLESFQFRLRLLVRHGGFALISGEPGLGKSKTLQVVADWLQNLDELSVGVMQRPQSKTGDFYRELGDVFGVDLAPRNRWGSFKALRERFRSHMKATLMRPVLLMDEAQEVCTSCLTELRLLSSANFDSENLLTVVLCGDRRLPNRFRSAELLPLGSRVRVRLHLKPWASTDLKSYLDHALAAAGAPQLMAEGLRDVLCEQAMGNLRMLTTMCGDILAYGVQNKLRQLDEAAFFEAFGHGSQLDAKAGASR